MTAEPVSDSTSGGAPDAAALASEAADAEFEELLSAATGAAGVVHRRARSKLAMVLWTLAAVPGGALLLLLSMAVRVRLADGSWPVRNQPDPKELGLHNTITVLAILGSFVVVILVPLIALMAYFTGSRRIPIRPPVVAAAGLAALALVLVGDLGGLGEWIGD